jgi:hypothetical protein
MLGPEYHPHMGKSIYFQSLIAAKYTNAMMIALHMTFVSSSSGSEATGLVLSTGIASMYRRGLAFEIDR